MTWKSFVRGVLLVCLLAWAAVSAAHDRYRVTLRFDADDDPDVVARQLAATYRIDLEPGRPDPSTIVVRGSDAGMRMLRADRRVIAVEPADSRGFGAYA
ncbi:MAG TPA: hypothetical protein VHK90_06855 [Thermoanaerobaculia bacterium]|nr:hypothetical protein [Thermoanaerobaculia bacterium]